MGVLESPGKVVDFIVSKRVGTLFLAVFHSHISICCVTGFLRHVADCTTDSSWFVKKAAINLISKILSSGISNTPALSACNGGLSDEEEKMITTVFAPLITDIVHDLDQLSVCLELLDNREALMLILSYLRLDKQHVVQRLCTLLKYPASRSSRDDETRILEILSSVCEACDDWNAAQQELMLLVTDLLNDGKVLSAVVVAVWLLRRFVAT